ncbi:ubiquitin-like protein [Trypanosoma cruzi]|nr:ubiquitin-like protein [Trypanosoma cruzi]
MEEGEANRSGTQGSTACTYGESGPSCRHPSWKTRTHTRCSAHSNTKAKNKFKGEIPAHHVDCWSTGSAANIHHKNNSVSFGPPSYSAHTTSCRPGNHSSSSRTHKNKRRKWNKASNHLFVFLFGCWQMSACFVFFFFAEGKPSCLDRVLGIPAGCTIIVSFLL